MKRSKRQKLFENNKIWRFDLLLKFMEIAQEYRDLDLSIVLSPYGVKEYTRDVYPDPLIEPGHPKKIILGLQKRELDEEEKRKKVERGDLPYLLKKAEFDEEIDIAEDASIDEKTKAAYKEIITLSEYANVRMQVYNHNKKSKFKLNYNDEAPGIDYRIFLMNLTMYAGHLYRRHL